MKCKQCSNSAVDGKLRCQHHLDLRSAQAKRRRNKLLFNNKCSCGNDLERSMKRCVNCAQEYAHNLKLRRLKKSESGYCPECGKKNNTDNYRCNKCSQNRIENKNKLKREVFLEYGGVRCSCLNCPEQSGCLEFLTIDHIDSNGAEHRREIGRGGLTLYRWLKKNNYPTGYRVLCYNCNAARHWNNGICPHEI